MKKLFFILSLFFVFLFWACGEDEELKKEDDLCKNITCGDNSFCKDGKCLCKKGYHHEGKSCLPDFKFVNCDDSNVPENANAVIEEVKISYSERNGWSFPSYCDWVCKDGYYKKDNECREDLCIGIECAENSSCSKDDGICYCDAGFHPSSDGKKCIDDNICQILNCPENSECDYDNGICKCKDGYHEENGECKENEHNECGGCNGHGECLIKENNDPVCACDTGYTPDDDDGLHCVLTSTVCKGGAVNLDYDLDGEENTWFIPNDAECDMFELINFVRAVHDKEGSHESHKPLKYDVLLSAYARMHSQRMTMRPLSDDNPERYGEFEHGDYPPGWGGQNIAYSSDSHGHMGMYMGCSNPKEPICVSQREGHCDMLSHHCNIMRPRFRFAGVGIYNAGYDYSTQNFR